MHIPLLILYTHTHTHTHTEDTCHYHKESDLNEYVLNNRGYIWVGSAYSNYGRPWQFAQYKKDCTDVSFWLLDKLTHENRADPVKVSLRGRRGGGQVGGLSLSVKVVGRRGRRGERGREKELTW